MRFIYTLLIFIAALPATLWLARRGRQTQEARGRWRERYGCIPTVPGGVAVWVHAVSVGEVRAAIPLVNALLAQHGDQRVAVTCLTPTGSVQVQQLWGSRVHHSYLPFDLPFAVQRFLQRLQPQQLIVFETELWPNLYRATAQRGIPIFIANARLSERSLRSYRRVGGWIREVLRQCTCIAAQSEMDADRFRQLGALQVTTVGNIKYDVEVPLTQVAEGRQLRALVGENRLAWVAASTHEDEELQALAAHRTVLAQVPDALLILVPRHPQRFEKVRQLAEQSGLRYGRRHSRDYGSTTQVLLGDSMGEMFVYLAAADIAFVGGSLVPIGGHNVLEPAALGMPVLFGPHMQNFIGARDLLLQAEAAIQIPNAEALAETLVQLHHNAAYRQRLGGQAQASVELNRGALTRLLAMVSAAPLRTQASARRAP